MNAFKVAGVIAAGLGIYAGGLLAFEAVRYRNQYEQEERKRIHLEAVRDEIGVLESVTAKLPEFAREDALLDSKLELLEEILPVDARHESIEAALRELAKRTGLVVARFTHGTVVRRATHEELSFELAVAGPRDGLARFLGGIHGLPRLMDVSRLEMQRGAGGQIDAKVGVLSYRVPPGPTSR